ncbi:MAG TPA: SMC family ATPase, partial [Chromatiales bacterium]|nr:SMC family ATPase [Chromatiales bacterium]
MIIKSISAENVLKYARLELDQIPERGIIAIGGQNESGKSTIGETVCFALYGRTFSVGPEELDKVIRWGEVDCSARLTFSVGDGEDYEIVRYLDSDGNHSARLSRAGEEEAPLARGVSAVADRLGQLIGYDYDQFIDSFYLAQREITTPHAHGYTVKTMAGIAPLERCAEQFEEEIGTEEEVVVDTESQVKVFEQELAELEIDDELLPALESERQEVGRKEAELNKRVESLEHASVNYQDNAPKMWEAQKKRGFAGFMRWLTFLIAALGGGSWLLLTQAPDTPLAKNIQNALSGLGAGWDEAKVVYLLIAATFFAVLFILFWMRRSSQNKLA